jgi:hypothetical protein
MLFSIGMRTPFFISYKTAVVAKIILNTKSSKSNMYKDNESDEKSFKRISSWKSAAIFSVSGKKRN